MGLMRMVMSPFTWIGRLLVSIGIVWATMRAFKIVGRIFTSMGLLWGMMFLAFMSAVVVGIYQTGGTSYGVCAGIVVFAFALWFDHVGFFSK